MKFAVIDIGSNSVRLMIWADGKTLYKRIITTRLGQGLNVSGSLSNEATARTIAAVSRHLLTAETECVDAVYAFATEAVRSAKNGGEFVDLVKKECGVCVDVLSGEEEALAGICGAVSGKDGASIDIGGASAELTVKTGGKVVYSKSIPLGVVRLKDVAGRDMITLEKIIDDCILAYGNISGYNVPLYAIGGTATTLSAVVQGLSPYDPKKVHLSVLTRSQIENFTQKFLTLPIEEIKKMKGMEESRADVIGGGCLLLLKIMQKFGVDRITVSESDNLEGYLLCKVIK